MVLVTKEEFCLTYIL